MLAARVPNRVEITPFSHTEASTVYQVVEQFAGLGIVVKALPVNAFETRKFCELVNYSEVYPGYAGSNFPEKCLEHFVASSLLAFSNDDILVDIVADDSPFAGIVHRVFDSTTFTQDSARPSGVDGDFIGGAPWELPLPDAFVSKVSLLSALEHCESDTDSRLFKELARVLHPGGKVVVAPLYMFTEPAILTDPTRSAESGVPFDPGTTIHCVKGWGHRHGRFYSPQTLKDRILRFSDQFRFTIYHVLGTEHLTGSIYLRFVLAAERI